MRILSVFVFLLLAGQVLNLAIPVPVEANTPQAPSGCSGDLIQASSFSEWAWRATDSSGGTMSLWVRPSLDSQRASFVLQDLTDRDFTGQVQRSAGTLSLSGYDGPTGSDGLVLGQFSADEASLSGSVIYSGRYVTFQARRISCRPTSTTVVVIQGIDSTAGCDDAGYIARMREIAEAVKETGNTNVVGFSYSGKYDMCHTGAVLPILPSYAAENTCGGVQQAAILLGDQLAEITNSRPDASFVLVAHSLGGLVATYAYASELPPELRVRVAKIVLLDSPVDDGYPLRNPISACQGRLSSADLSGDSPFLQVINDQANGLDPRMVTSVISSPIGDVFQGSRKIVARCYSNGATGPILFGFLGSFINPWIALIGMLGGMGVDVQGAHGCVWSDPFALRAIADAASQ